jgi:hypothetical protein
MAKYSRPYLGNVSPRVLKRLKKIKPTAPDRTPDTEIIPLSYAPEFALDITISEVDTPQWLSCGMAMPHTDWDSYFLGVSVQGRREFGEYIDEDVISHTILTPGTVFVVDGSKLHWLGGADGRIPRGWWMGLQWELSPKRVDCAYIANAILNLLGVDTTNVRKSGVDERYKHWI